MDALELRADGTAAHSGDILGHHVFGTGIYTADGARVTVRSDIKTVSDMGAVLDVSKDEMTFEKQGIGDLKVLSTCKKVYWRLRMPPGSTVIGAHPGK
jgi:hypothetical protein